MAVAYEQFENDPIEAESLQSSDSDDALSDQILVLSGSGGDTAGDDDGHDARIHRMHNFLQNKWPYTSSGIQLGIGIILVCLGLVQILILPILDDTEGNKIFAIAINRSNAFGIAEWIGIVFVLGGCVGLRAAIHKSITSVYIYFGVILFELLATVAAILLLIIAYSNHWTTIGGLEGDKVRFYVHLSATLCVCAGFLVVIYSFVQYYEDVLFGELQCCKRAVHCLMPCLCPKAVQGHELLQDNDERPPSLPV